MNYTDGDIQLKQLSEAHSFGCADKFYYSIIGATPFYNCLDRLICSAPVCFELELFYYAFSKVTG